MTDEETVSAEDAVTDRNDAGRDEADTADGAGTDREDAPRPESGRGTGADPGGDQVGTVLGGDAQTTVLRAALVALSLVSLVALWGFYTSVDAAIGVWVADRYRAVARAGFNLAVLLAAGAGVSLVVRALGGDATGDGR